MKLPDFFTKFLPGRKPSMALVLLLTTVVLLIAVFRYAATIADRELNSSYHPDITYTRTAFHDELFIADLHSDTLLWNRALSQKSARGQIDFPRMQAGNIRLQVLAAVTKAPFGLNVYSNPSDSDMITPLSMAQGWPVKTWNSPLQRALYQSEKLEQDILASNGHVSIIRSRSDLKALTETHDKFGVLLAIEGAQALEGKADNIQTLFDAGYRMIGLSHFFDTQFGGSAHGERKYGLTKEGRKLVQKMLETNMMIDIAHSSLKVIDDVLAMTDQPLVVSHTGVKGTCKSPRNMSDRHIKAVAERGGIIGIGFFKSAVCGDQMSDIVRAIKYTVALAGIDHVALGSDFDGATHTILDAEDIAAITEALQHAGFTQEEIRKIMGENILRLFETMLPA